MLSVQSDREFSTDEIVDQVSSAVLRGDREALQLMIQAADQRPECNNIEMFNAGLRSAALKGHIDIVNSMIEQGATNFNEAFACAAVGGHLVIAHLLIEKGVTNFGDSLLSAVRHRDLEMVRLIADQGVDLNGELYLAAYYNLLEICDLLIEKGATAFDLGLHGATCGGHLKIVNFLFEKGTNFPWKISHYKQSLRVAVRNNRTEIAHLLIERL